MPKNTHNDGDDQDLFHHNMPAESLKGHGGNPFDLQLSAADCARVAAQIGADAVRKLRFSGGLRPHGKNDWELTAKLGATVVQPCVVTLAPVLTRIDSPITRVFLKQMPVYEVDEEVELTGDENAVALESEIDLGQIIVEELAILLPEYPKSTDASLKIKDFSGPGITPMSDEDAKPFAALAQLRKKLEE